MYYFYRKSNRGHGICPLYRGCPPFGESVIIGFTQCSMSNAEASLHRQNEKDSESNLKIHRKFDISL